MLRFYWIYSFFSLLAVMPASAGNFTSDTSASNNYLSQTFSLESPFDKDSKSTESITSWNSSISGSGSRTQDSATGQSVDSKSYGFSAGLSKEWPMGWSLDSNIRTDLTPTENLRSSGIEIGSDFRTTSEDTNEMNWSAGLRVGSTTFLQTSSVTRARKQVTGTNSIRQKMIDLHFSIKPVSWLRIGIRLETFQYDKDVSEFLNHLDEVAIFSKGGDGLANAVQSFPDKSQSLRLNFYLSEQKSLTLGQKWSEAVVDHSQTQTTTISAFSNLTSSLGGEISIDSSLYNQQRSNAVSCTLTFSY